MLKKIAVAAVCLVAISSGVAAAQDYRSCEAIDRAQKRLHAAECDSWKYRLGGGTCAERLKICRETGVYRRSGGSGGNIHVKSPRKRRD
jgi:hypothetical protein